MNNNRLDRMNLTDRQEKALFLLSEKQLAIFMSLTETDKRKLLKKAERIAEEEYIIDKQKEKKIREKQKKKPFITNKRRTKQAFSQKKHQTEKFKRTTSIVKSVPETMSKVLGIMLAETQEEKEENKQGLSDKSVSLAKAPAGVVIKSSSKIGSYLSSKIASTPIGGKINKTLNKLKNSETYEKAKKIFVGNTNLEKQRKANEKFQKKVMKKSIGSLIVFAPSLFAIMPILLVILPVILIVVLLGGSISSQTASSVYEASVSAKTKAYTELVEKYCEKYDIIDYVDLCLAVIEQESGGNPPDVMQAEQSYYNTKPPIDDAEESIDCGVHELSDCLKSAKSENENDIEKISLALQGYNFGNGYIAWAVNNYKGYSLENAKIFSQKMCSEHGYLSYGDVEYVPHVLRYYIEVDSTSITNQSADKIVKELKDKNEASSSVWKVIDKGASLVGKVTYSMAERQDDGRAEPDKLDCSSFVAWSFHKGGCNAIAYTSTTATFRESTKFIDIEEKDLKVGDIGLKSKTAGTGGANHVGIYCGKLKDGTKVWMHCTSSSSTSLTGNDSGVMLGAYTNFTYFRRLKKFDK